MKKMLTVLAFSCISFGVFAQEKSDAKMPMEKHDMGKMKDCVMMEEGKMMVMKGGETMAMDEDMTLSNGTTVMKDGTVKMKDGKTMMLKNGQCVYMNGKVSTMKMHGMKGEKMKM